jgi:hypothetical protein
LKNIKPNVAVLDLKPDAKGLKPDAKLPTEIKVKALTEIKVKATNTLTAVVSKVFSVCNIEENMVNALLSTFCKYGVKKGFSELKNDLGFLTVLGNECSSRGVKTEGLYIKVFDNISKAIFKETKGTRAHQFAEVNKNAIPGSRL